MKQQEVRLIGMTQPEEAFKQLSGANGPEELISYIARVSSPNNQKSYNTADKLLNYLMKNSHFSPFEMVQVILEIETTRDIGRQILRHGSAKFQEFSQRYASPKAEDFYIRECRFQDTKNRQSSIDAKDFANESGTGTTIDIVDWFERAQKKHVADSLELYNRALRCGIAKEQARCFLPEGNTPSTMYMTMNLRDWIFYCRVRTDISTQKEHREIANKVWTILCEEFKFLNNFPLKNSEPDVVISNPSGSSISFNSSYLNFLTGYFKGETK